MHIDCFSLPSNLSTVLAHSSVLLDLISHYSNIFKYTNFLGIKHTPRVSLNQFVMLTVILTESRVIWETGLWPHTCRDYFEVGRKTLPLWVAPLPGWGPGLCKWREGAEQQQQQHPSLSASWLWIPCEQLLQAPVVLAPSPCWTVPRNCAEENPSSFQLILFRVFLCFCFVLNYSNRKQNKDTV